MSPTRFRTLSAPWRLSTDRDRFAVPHGVSLAG
jgi:hypothetical protein